MQNMKALFAGFLGMANIAEAIESPQGGVIIKERKPLIRHGIIMPRKQWQKRKSRLKMQSASRKANRNN